MPNTLDQWLDYLSACHPENIALGLERVASVLEALRLDLSASRVISFAGTNGKGSCLALSEAALRSAGHSVLAYTSPHFLDYNERLRWSGVAVSDASFCEAFAEIEVARGETPLTYFEFGTLAALVVAHKRKPDFLLLEVGLGGRLDAVNIVDAEFAVLSSIGLDHQDWLGDDREQIGREKAGIFRPDAWAICGDPEPPESISAVADACSARLRQRGRDFALSGHQHPHILDDNIATVAELLRLLNLEAHLQPALDSVCLAGRFQQFQIDDKELIIDVAHNPDAVEQLVQRLQTLPRPNRVVALFAVMTDKDYDSLIKIAQPAFDAWFLAPLKGQPRALDAEDLVHILAGHGEHMISLSKNVRQAYRRALSLLNPGDRLVVFGSFFLLAEVMAILRRDGIEIPGLSAQEGSGE